jgi:hypothetical protein
MEWVISVEDWALIRRLGRQARVHRRLADLAEMI